MVIQSQGQTVVVNVGGATRRRAPIRRRRKIVGKRATRKPIQQEAPPRFITQYVQQYPPDATRQIAPQIQPDAPRRMISPHLSFEDVLKRYEEAMNVKKPEPKPEVSIYPLPNLSQYPMPDDPIELPPIPEESSTISINDIPPVVESSSSSSSSTPAKSPEQIVNKFLNALPRKTKEQLVELGNRFNLDLNLREKKEDMINKIREAYLESIS